MAYFDEFLDGKPNWIRGLVIWLISKPDLNMNRLRLNWDVWAACVRSTAAVVILSKSLAISVCLIDIQNLAANAANRQTVPILEL